MTPTDRDPTTPRTGGIMGQAAGRRARSGEDRGSEEQPMIALLVAVVVVVLVALAAVRRRWSHLLRARFPRRVRALRIPGLRTRQAPLTAAAPPRGGADETPVTRPPASRSRRPAVGLVPRPGSGGSPAPEHRWAAPPPAPPDRRGPAARRRPGRRSRSSPPTTCGRTATRPLQCRPLQCRPLQCRPLQCRPLQCRPLRGHPLQRHPPRARVTAGSAPGWCSSRRVAQS